SLLTFGASAAPPAGPLAIVPVAPSSLQVEKRGAEFVFRIPEGAQGGRLSILDASGREVWSHAVAAGSREMAWSGQSFGGRRLSQGLYIARLSRPAGDKSASAREGKIFYTP